MSTIHQAASRLKGRIKKKKLNALRSLLKSPQKKGVIVKCRIMSPKKPNSAKRKVAKILLSNTYHVTAKIKGKGPFLNKFNNVLVCGGRANDLPGVRFNMIKGKFDFTWKEPFFRMNSRSKYGIAWDDYYWRMSEEIEKDSDEAEEVEIQDEEEAPWVEKYKEYRKRKKLEIEEKEKQLEIEKKKQLEELENIEKKQDIYKIDEKKN